LKLDLSDYGRGRRVSHQIVEDEKLGLAANTQKRVLIDQRPTVGMAGGLDLALVALGPVNHIDAFAVPITSVDYSSSS